MANNDHAGKRLIVNGQEVSPGKKVKLLDYLSKKEIEDLIANVKKRVSTETERLVVEGTQQGQKDSLI